MSSEDKNSMESRLIDELDTVKELLGEFNNDSPNDKKQPSPIIPVLRNPVVQGKANAKQRNISENQKTETDHAEEMSQLRQEIEQAMEKLIERKMRVFKEHLRHELRKEIDKHLKNKD